MNIPFAAALEKILEYLDYRGSARKKLFESEFEEFCNQFIEQQRYFISEISVLIAAVEEEIRTLKSVSVEQDSDCTFNALPHRLEKVLSEVDQNRPEGLAARMSIYKIAKDRLAEGYFSTNFLHLVSDAEKEDFKLFFQLIVGSFEYSRNLTFEHVLSHCLDDVKRCVKVAKEKGGKFSGLEKELELLLNNLKMGRNFAVASSGEVQAVQDRIRRSLHDLR